jgi:hypothetical protein
LRSFSPRASERQYTTRGFGTKGDCLFGRQRDSAPATFVTKPAMAFETRSPARKHHGGHDDNISLIDSKSFFLGGQCFPEEAIDEFEGEVVELDPLGSRWLHQPKPDDSYRAVCTTVVVDVKIFAAGIAGSD